MPMLFVNFTLFCFIFAFKHLGMQDVPCLQCEEYAEDMMHLEGQLSDSNIIQENLRQKLLKTKATLSATIERESKLRLVMA